MLKKNIRYRKWLLNLLLGVLISSFLILSIVFMVDPFLQYRSRDKGYILNPRYVTPGLIKNFDYDTIIIGSSMTQNFNMQVFREYFNDKPLHVNCGGMTTRDIVSSIKLANKINKAKKYYICIDLANFNSNTQRRIPEHLFRDDFFSKIRYSFSHEVWFEFIPVDMFLLGIQKIGKQLPEDYKYRIDVDYLGYWAHQHKFSRAIVMNKYQSNIDKVSEVDNKGLNERMKKNIDKFFEDLKDCKDKYNFFFPPYSVLFWHNADKKGYIKQYLDAKRYFVTKAIQQNHNVYDFQAEEFICDLDNYKDTTHYKPEINDWMTKCFYNNSNLVNDEITAENETKLLSILQKFSINNHY